MYIPQHYAAADRAAVISFMKQFSFATLVTHDGGIPIASHLPFVISVVNDQLLLTAHVAKANTQWQQLAERPVLVIFNEPHAYISPRLYEKVLNVPTWNYVAVHAYGNARITHCPKETTTALEAMINQYEPAYAQQWQYLPEEFKSKMLNGIVAFEITVTDLQAKHKLSQNKSETERRRIVNTLLDSEQDNERMIGEFMRRTLQ